MMEKECRSCAENMLVFFWILRWTIAQTRMKDQWCHQETEPFGQHNFLYLVGLSWIIMECHLMFQNHFIYWVGQVSDVVGFTAAAQFGGASCARTIGHMPLG